MHRGSDGITGKNCSGHGRAREAASGLHLNLGLSAGVLFALAVAPVVSSAQNRRPLEPPIASQRETPQHRTRLFLKDGTFQTVLSYAVRGDVVRYRSAERNGAEEDIPLELVDLAATQAWERAHDPAAEPTGAPQGQTPVLSPELAREEAARAARTPEVAKDLRLPEGDSVLVLDTFQGTPELVPLPQNGSDLNRETAHAVLKKEINPSASPHDLLFLKEERADVQVHVPDPVFYFRLEGADKEDADTGGAFVVDTQGQTGKATPGGASASSRYIVERVDVRRGERAIASPRLSWLGTGRQQADVIETRLETLPGNVWQRVTPVQPLPFGEYAVIEILNDRAINSYAWDFGVHPTAKENDEAQRPEPKRPAQLERRRR